MTPFGNGQQAVYHNICRGTSIPYKIVSESASAQLFHKIQISESVVHDIIGQQPCYVYCVKP